MEIEEIQLIDNSFLSIKTKILEFFNLKKVQDKSDFYKKLLLHQGFFQIYSDTQEIKSLPLVKYILEKMDDLINDLEIEISIKKPSQKISSSLQSTRDKYWLSLKTLLSDTRKYISEEIYSEVLLNDIPNEKLVLNRAQIALLMLYLRDKKAIQKFKDNQLAIRFHELTGYSDKQLRLLIVKDAKIEKNLITEKENDYINLINLLLSIITDLEGDMKKAILK